MEGIADRAPRDSLHPCLWNLSAVAGRGCFDIIFTVVLLRLHQTNLLYVTIIHGDGTISQLHYAFRTLAYTMINLRHFC